MADVGDILNDNEFFGDVVNTPNEGIEQDKKREKLKSAMDKGRLGHKRKHERVDKASDEITNKTYAEHKQRELNKKGEKNWEDLGQTCHGFVFNWHFWDG